MLKFIFVLFFTTSLVNCTLVKNVGDFQFNRYCEPNSIYRFAVTSYVKPTASNITVGIRRGDIRVSKDIVVQPKTTEIFELVIGDIPVGQYNFFIINDDDSVPKKIALVTCEIREVHLRIGTFMPFWFQDSNITFIVHRTKSRDEKVLPLNRDDFKFSVIDPSKNRHEIEPNHIDSSSKNFLVVQFGVPNKGVGEHVMEANYNNSIQEMRFRVFERNSKNFTIKLDPYIHNDTNGNLEMIIDIHTSKLTGEIFEGQGFINVHFEQPSISSESYKSTLLKIEVPTFRERIQVKTNLNYTEIDQHTPIKIQAELQDKTHGQIMKSAKIDLDMRRTFESSTNYVLYQSHSTFTPGIPFVIRVDLLSQIHVPIYDKENPITITYQFGVEAEEELHKQILPTSSLGFYEFAIDIKKSVEFMNYTIKYKDLSISAQHRYELDDPFIQIRFISTTVAEVTSNEVLSSVTYIIKSGLHSEILQAKTLHIDPPSKLVTFKLENMQQMPPQSIMVVKYFSQSRHKLIEQLKHLPVTQLCLVEHTGNNETFRKIIDFHKPMEISIKCDFSTKMIILIDDENLSSRQVNKRHSFSRYDYRDYLPELSKYLPRTIVLDVTPNKTIYEIGTVPPEWNTIIVNPMRFDEYGNFGNTELIFETKDFSSN